MRIWRHFRGSAEIRVWRHFRGSAEIRVWRHFRGSAFFNMVMLLGEIPDKISAGVQAPFYLCTIYFAPSALNASLSIEANYWVSWRLNERRDESWKLLRSAKSDTAEIRIFDVTSVGQRLTPWTCNSVKVEIKFHLECELHCPCAQLMLRQMHLTNASESIEAKYWVSWLGFDV